MQHPLEARHSCGVWQQCRDERQPLGSSHTSNGQRTAQITSHNLNLDTTLLFDISYAQAVLDAVDPSI